MNMKNLNPNLLNHLISKPLLSSIVTLGVLVLISLPASAATFTVNSLDDNGVGDCDGITCTLRDALSESVTDGEPSVIDFAPGLSGVITLQQGELHVVGADLDIQGPGPELITVSGNNASRVFHFNNSASTMSLSGLTITDGYIASGQGAGIYVLGEDIVLENLRVINNTTDFIGGGIAYFFSSGIIRNSEVSNNLAARGSGIAINGSDGDDVLIENVTISGNIGNQAESGINVLTNTNQTVTLRYVTVSNNSGSPNGASISGNGEEFIEASIFFGHDHPTGKDLFINQNSVINNSIIGLTDSSLNGINNLVGLDPLLLPLNFYQGSAQQIHALANGQSIAVDHVDDLIGDAECNLSVTGDQLGQSRPVNGRCDAGAFELPLIPSDPPVLDPIGDQTIDEFQTLSFTATASDPDTAQVDLAFTLSGEPAGAVITTDGDFSFTPTESQVGPYSFDVIVSDDGFPMNMDQETITVTINEINQPPVLDPIANQTVMESETLQFTATATDGDIPVQTLVFSLMNAPEGAEITSDGVFTFTPNATQGTNDYVFDIIVSDDASSPLSDSQSITITVQDDTDLIFFNGFE